MWSSYVRCVIVPALSLCSRALLPPVFSPTAQAKKQALQHHILTVVKGHRLAGVAVAMDVGKNHHRPA